MKHPLPGAFPMGERPAGRPWHARARLDHFCIVTWALEPARLAQALPAGLRPQTFEVVRACIGPLGKSLTN